MPVNENRVTDTSRMNLEPGSWQETLYEFYVGFYVGIAHNLYFLKHVFNTCLGNPVMKALGMDNATDHKPRVGNGDKGLKVVGVGYGRTGTYSLALALDELGFPTLHTQHLYENDEIFAMWANEIFQPSIDAGKAFMGKPDFDLIASHGFQATMDLPIALYFEQVQQQYPDCKFILTTRENSEVWFRSWDVLTKSITQPAKVGSFFLTKVNRLFIYLRWLFAIVNKDSNYLTCPYPLPDQQKEQAIASYEAHNARVRATIPSDHLLEYNVEQGWEPLCKFLEIEQCPTTPFPKSNSARSVQVQAIASVVMVLVIVLFTIFLATTFVFQSITGKTILAWVSDKYFSLIQRLAIETSAKSHGRKVGKHV